MTVLGLLAIVSVVATCILATDEDFQSYIRDMLYRKDHESDGEEEDGRPLIAKDPATWEMV